MKVTRLILRHLLHHYIAGPHSSNFSVKLPSNYFIHLLHISQVDSIDDAYSDAGFQLVRLMAGVLVKSAITNSATFATRSDIQIDDRMSAEAAIHQRDTVIINITSNDGSTGKGILIGMLSAFGSAAFVVLIFAIFYLFRHTNRGRILLERLGRPGEYDDEQALAREEAEALEGMDDLRRVEYLRAKGAWQRRVLPSFAAFISFR